jgi:hypothetical protein
MSKKKLIRMVLKLAVTEFARRKLRGNPAARTYGYGRPPRRGLKGRFMTALIRRVERLLR